MVNTRWEHKTLVLDWSDVSKWSETLDAFGADGWEVAASAAPPPPVTSGMTYGIPPFVIILKRRL